MRDQQNESGVAPIWFGAYLVAALVVGVAAGVILYREGIGGEGPQARLLPMLLVAELVIYTVTLALPGERVVPPGRAVAGIIFGMAIRACMAFLTAAAVRLGSPTLSQGDVMVAVYARLWLAALVQVLLVLLYLWLIRGALETDRLKPPVRRARARAKERASAEREAGAAEDEERRRRLLNALLDSQEAARRELDNPPPTVAPPPACPAPAVPPASAEPAAPVAPPPALDAPALAVAARPAAEGEASAAPAAAQAGPAYSREEPVAQRPPWAQEAEAPAVEEPPEEPPAAVAVAPSAGDTAEEAAPAVPEAAAEVAAPEPSETVAPTGEEARPVFEGAPDGVPEPVAAGASLTSPSAPAPAEAQAADVPETVEKWAEAAEEDDSTAAFGPVAPVTAAPQLPFDEEPTEAVPVSEPEPALVPEPAGEDLLPVPADGAPAAGADEAADEPMAAEAVAPEAPAAETALAAAALPETPAAESEAAPESAGETPLAALLRSARQAVVASGGEELEAALLAGPNWLALAASVDGYCACALAPETNIRLATLALRQLRQAPRGERLADAGPAMAPAPASPYAAELPVAGVPDMPLEVFAGRGPVAVAPGAADSARLAAAAEAAWQAACALNPAGDRLLLYASGGGVLVGRLADDLLLVMPAAAASELAAHNLRFTRLLSGSGG